MFALPHPPDLAVRDHQAPVTLREWFAQCRRVTLALWQRVDHQGLGYIAAVFAVSRALLVATTFVAARVTVPATTPPIFGRPTPPQFWRAWFSWDAYYYTKIARIGYTLQHVAKHPAFFPLYPLTERIVHPLTHGNYYLAGLLIANVAWFVALSLLYRLARRDFDARVARGAVIALSVFPTAFYGFVPYPEALLLAFAIGSLLCMREGRWGQAALWGMLAALTRLSGLALILPFVWEYATQHGFGWEGSDWRRFDVGRVRWPRLRADSLWVLLIPTGTLLYALWLWRAVGDPLAFVHAERSWYRQTTLPPITLWHGLRQALLTTGFYGWRAWQELLVVLAVQIVILVGLRRVPVSYSLLAVTLALLFLAEPQAAFPLESQSRYALEIFPIFIVLGDLATRRRWRMAALVVACLPLQLILMAIFSRGGWIV